MIEIVNTGRGGDCALHNGHRYKMKRKFKNKNVFWTCAQKNCKSSIVTKKNRITQI